MQVVLSIGTNTDYGNIEIAEERLRGLFSAVRVSRTIVSPAVDNPGEWPDYANAVMVGNALMDYDDLRQTVKHIEHQMGRTVNGAKQHVPIDIDILQYGTKRYKPKDWQRPYNVTLLNEMTATQ